MKRFSIYALTLALSATFALYVTSCGRSHSSNGSMTVVSTSTQAAQAASASIKTARNVMVIGSALAMITSAATSGGSGLPLAPVMGLRASAATFPVTIDCATNTTITGGSTSTPDSITIVGSGIGPFTVTFNACREGTAQVDGVMTATLTGIIAATLTLGTDTAPLTVTEYAGALSSSVVDVLKTTSHISFSQSGATDTFVATGSFENWDYVAHGHEKQIMTNFKIAVTTGTATVGGANYTADTFTVNGPSTGTVYVSDTDSTISYTKSDSYSNFVIVGKTPVPGSPDFDYLTMTGTFSISTSPAGKCIDGTFSIATNSDVKIDNTTETVVAGQLAINAAAVAAYNADGSLTVTVSGGSPTTFSESELAGLCSL